MSNKKKPEVLNKTGGLEQVLERNAYYSDQYYLSFLVMVFLLFINIILLVGIVYKITHPPQPVYFPTNADGSIIDDYALSDPVKSDDYVLQWTSDQVRLAFSQDYVHYKAQFMDVQGSFTNSGWNDFFDAVKKSNNLTTLTTQKMVSSAEITTAPYIVKKLILSGHYAWNIKMSIAIKFENSQNSPIIQTYDVNVVVLREPVVDYPDGIAINNFLPTPQKTS